MPLPKPVVPEKGSRKIIKGMEFWTKHNFTTEMGNVLETVDGAFILPNGDPAKNKTILELLPGQHRERALAWWEKRFGGEIKDRSVEVDQKGPTTQDLLGIIEDLQRQVAVLTARSTEKSPTEDESSRKEKLSEVLNTPEPEKGKTGVRVGRPKGKVLTGSEALKGLNQASVGA